MKIVKSPLSSKKYRAIFDNGKHVDFGASGYDDYILSGNDVKKKAYIARHRVNENWNDPYSSGCLSRYILWNKKTLKESIEDYKKRFNM